MRKSSILFVSSLTFVLQAAAISAPINSSYPLEDTVPDVAPLTPAPDFAAFTGKVTKNKVRLRANPSLDSPILREMQQGDMLIVVGETDDFYAVRPPAGTKAFVFRSYVLENVVEANRVNVRSEPDVDAPVIAQLNIGEHLDGTVSSLNNKWLEIAPPASSRFFVAKDYIEKIGDPSVMTAIEKRRDEVNHLVNSTYLVCEVEMQKSFPEINLDGVYANFNKVITNYPDFPAQVARARELISMIQDSYLQKKIAYLESKAKNAQDDWQTRNAQLNDQMKAQQQRLAQLESQLKKEKANKAAAGNSLNTKSVNPDHPGLSDKMAAWLPVEQGIFETWAAQNANRTQDDYYDDQRENALVLRGIVEPYTRVIKNKPGDYMLVNQSNHLPIAFIYSTQVNLQDMVGQEVTIHATSRPNNNFAFPAYFVLSFE
jgi:uncharacterized protein YgiM (DUF1202 family)